ncbi:MAG: RHS repeat-associated core domain-containing protein [Chloroflexi bacterium]|nr:RHS repeat-associated core domain-containing protein [Chloroflexota bacterium]
MPTDVGYTGQRADASTGLMFYGARYYDSALARFVSADTIVPGAGNPQARNRYVYGLNSPVRFTDPTGHAASDEFGGGDVEGCYSLDCGWIIFPHDWFEEQERARTEGFRSAGETLSGFAGFVDVAALTVSGVGVAIVDGIGGLGTIVGVWEAIPILDGVVSFGPINGVENSLSSVAATTTLVADVLRNDTRLDANGLVLGRDTIISVRNVALGNIPEANVDFLINMSQVAYDIKRSQGEISNGPVRLFSNDFFSTLSWFR